MNDKTFKIAVLALLLLILGAVLGAFSSIYLWDDEEYLEFEEGEFLDPEADGYVFNRYTYDEYSMLTKQGISSARDLEINAIKQGYTLEFQDEGSISLSKELGCEKDQLDRAVCREEFIEADDEEETIETTTITYREDE